MLGVLRKVAMGRYQRVVAALLPFLPKPLRKALRRFHFRRGIRRALLRPTPPVLVYTTPKVASTAVAHALMSVEGQVVFHVHLISAAGIRALREGIRRRGLTRAKQDMNGLDDLGYALSKEIIKPRHRAKIVSLVREPIARNISFYFQTLDVLWKTERAHEHFGVERFLAGFHEKFTHERGINWFDSEFKPVTGIDVYEHPFPQDKGFLRINSGPYELLLMRHDLDDRLKEKCLADLLDVRSVSLVPRNVGTDKSYSEAYKEFLSRIRLSEDYVDRMLDSKYARHFYSPEELAAVRAKWLNGSSAQTSAAAAAGSPAVTLAEGDRRA
jgi:hypothetical protein